MLGRDRHELACSACGAPLHDLKRLPAYHLGKRELVQPSAIRPPNSETKPRKPPKPRKVKQKKKRKGLFREFLEEAFDVIEDVFD